MAVYTDVSDEALQDFLADFAIGDLVSFRGIARGWKTPTSSCVQPRGILFSLCTKSG